jgi:hypothetical protein
LPAVALGPGVAIRSLTVVDLKVAEGWTADIRMEDA